MYPVPALSMVTEAIVFPAPITGLASAVVSPRCGTR